MLVVVDHVSTRELLCDALRQEGYAVAGAANGIEAIELLMSVRPPSLVFFGLRMPGTDGIEAVAVGLASVALAAIPALLMSTVQGSSGLQFLQGPVSSDVLLRVTREHCGNGCQKKCLHRHYQEVASVKSS